MSLFKKSLFMLILLLLIPFTNAQTCYDSDGGLNYLIKGCVTLGNAIYCDNCISSSFLSEVYCTENKLNMTVYDCSPMVCEDGKCTSAIRTTSATTTIPSTTQTTSTPSSTTTIPSFEKCDSCSEACRIECSQTIRRLTLQGDSDYFKFTLPTEKKVKIRLTSILENNEYGDYDLFANWDGTCPEVGRYYPNECSTEGGYDCGPCSVEREEECERILKPGTYYFMVYNYKGENYSYDVSLACLDVIPTKIASTTKFCTVNTDCCDAFKGYWVTCSDGKCIRCAPNVEGCSYCLSEITTTIPSATKQTFLLNLTNALKNPLFIVLVLMVILIMFVVYKFVTKRVEPTPISYEEEEEVLVRMFLK